MSHSNSQWPTEIRLMKDKRTLCVSFEDGSHFHLAAEYLRVESPSAEVKGHSPAERKTVPGKRNVTISAIDSVGNYAVKLKFDDGHDTGLFTWDYLHELGQTYSQKWPTYEANLASLGLSRDRG
jgi:DUF971 family protein